jgi:hypothetical protein
LNKIKGKSILLLSFTSELEIEGKLRKKIDFAIKGSEIISKG